MKSFINKLFLIIIALGFVSCATIDVATDYDREVDFNQYKSYAFYKPGIDKAEISDLDKKRILRAIDFELSKKGMNKSESPDLLVSIFTKTKEEVNVYQNNFGYGYGWSPYYWGSVGRTSSYTTTKGTLFIDLIDASRNELVWQGLGTGVLSQNMDKKEEKIKEIVREILNKFPPQKNTDKKKK